jgi:hypothetical protein
LNWPKPTWIDSDVCCMPALFLSLSLLLSLVPLSPSASISPPLHTGAVPRTSIGRRTAERTGDSVATRIATRTAGPRRRGAWHRGTRKAAGRARQPNLGRGSVACRRIAGWRQSGHGLVTSWSRAGRVTRRLRGRVCRGSQETAGGWVGTGQPRDLRLAAPDGRREDRCALRYDRRYDFREIVAALSLIRVRRRRRSSRRWLARSRGWAAPRRPMRDSGTAL